MSGNHPRKGDDDPPTARPESESHFGPKGRGNGHSFWAYWAPFFLAVGAPLLGVPACLGQRRYLSQTAAVPLYR